MTSVVLRGSVIPVRPQTPITGLRHPKVPETVLGAWTYNNTVYGSECGFGLIHFVVTVTTDSGLDLRNS